MKGQNIQQENTLMPFCKKASVFLLLSIFIDCAVFGDGRLISIGSFDFRMMLYVLFCAISLPLVTRKCRYLLRNRYFFPFILLAIWIIIETLIGICNGNRAVVITADIEGFLSFGILPGAFCVLDNQEVIKKLTKAMVYIGFIYAIATCVLLIVHLYINPALQWELSFCLNHQYGLISYSPISEKISRITAGCHLYLIFSCTCALYFAVTEKKKKILYAGIIGFNLFSLLITYSRSIYFAALIVVVSIIVFGLLILEKKWNASAVKCSCMSVVVFLVIVLVFNLSAGTDYLSYGLKRSLVSFDTAGVTTPVKDQTPSVETPPSSSVETPPSSSVETPPSSSTEKDYLEITKASDSFREQNIADLMSYIKASPIVGHGIGAALSYRNATEYFWLNIVHKMGAIGLILYIAPIIFAVKFLLGKRSKSLSVEDRYMLACWMSGLLGICGFCCFNPFLNGSNGIVFYSFTIVAFNIFDPNTEIFHKKIFQKEGAL